MRNIISLIIITLCSLSIAAQPPQNGGKRAPLTEEQITELMARRTAMVKEHLQLTPEQEPIFDKEYANYTNIILASRTSQFKNRRNDNGSKADAVTAIYDDIDRQLAELVAKKQLTNNLKDVLSAEQLTKLNFLTNGETKMRPSRRNSNNEGRNSKDKFSDNNHM